MSKDDNLLPRLIQALGSENVHVFESAMELLIDLGPGIVPALIEALEQSDRNVRLGVLAVLGSLGPDARGAIAAVRRLVDDEDDEIAEAAAITLVQIRGEDIGLAA